MTIPFFKFDGAGNDFVVVDNREGRYHIDDDEVALICHRRFGVGADGLMTLDPATDGYDFTMHYYNSDGHLGSMCGNGGRCIVAFADYLGLKPASEDGTWHFLAPDGEHTATVISSVAEKSLWTVRLKMIDVKGISKANNGYFLNTGTTWSSGTMWMPLT